jgi:hypothetical protein
MTSFLCFLVWLYAAFSDNNKSTGLAIVAFIAMVSSCTDNHHDPNQSNKTQLPVASSVR